MTPLPKPQTPASRTVQILGIVVWLVLFVGVLLYATAKPEQETFLDRRWDKEVRTTWDAGQAHLGLRLMQINIALCILGLLLNILERAARGVHFNRSLILVGVASVLLVLILPGFS